MGALTTAFSGGRRNLSCVCSSVPSENAADEKLRLFVQRLGDQHDVAKLDLALAGFDFGQRIPRPADRRGQLTLRKVLIPAGLRDDRKCGTKVSPVSFVEPRSDARDERGAPHLVRTMHQPARCAVVHTTSAAPRGDALHLR